MQIDPSKPVIAEQDERSALSPLETTREGLARGGPDQPAPPSINTVAELTDVLRRGSPYLAAAIMYYRSALIESKIAEFALLLESAYGGDVNDSVTALSIVHSALRSRLYDLYRRDGEVPFTQESAAWTTMLGRTGGSPRDMAPLNAQGIPSYNAGASNASAAEPDAELVARWRARTSKGFVNDFMNSRNPGMIG